MKIVALADIHSRALIPDLVADDLRAADLAVLAGDVTDFGQADAVAEVLRAVRAHARRVLAVPGNCDHPSAWDWLEENGLGIHARHEVVGGVAFVGLGGSLPCPNRTPREFSEAELAGFLAAAARVIDNNAPLVLVCHQPPFGTSGDIAYRGGHVGSRAVRKFIEERRPVLCIAGHIHESRCIESLGPTTLVNPGSFRRGRYALVELDGAVVRAELRAVPRD